MTFLSDLRFALRLIRRAPGFTAVAVLTLALGIGGNTAMFTVINAVLLRPLPFPHADRLVMAWGSHPDIGHEAASLPDFTDWRAENDVFAGMAATSLRSINITTHQGPERVIGARVTADLFRVLGVGPALGRDFRPDDDAPGAPPVAILSHGLWVRTLGADPAIVGRPMTLNGAQYTVIGIMPQGFAMPPRAELWVPLAMSAAGAPRRDDFLQVVGRLKPGVTVDQAQAEMTTIASRLERAYPGTNTNWTIALVPLHEQLVGSVRPALLALWAAIVFVLLIACANVANLLLSRASGRRKEMAVRLALGAGRRQIVRQLLTESVLLALIGGAAGLLLAAWSVPLIASLAPPAAGRTFDPHLDATVLIFTLGASILTGLIFGLMPAINAARSDLQAVMKEGGRTAGHGAGASRTSRVLIVSQVALSLVLLVSAGLMVRTLQHLEQVDPGFRTDHLLRARVNLSAAQYASATAQRAFANRLAQNLHALPGAEAVALTDTVYLEGSGYSSMLIAGEPPPAPGEVHDAQIFSVSSGFQRTLGIRMRQGRQFEPQDGPEAPLVALVNEAFVKRYLSDGRALGRQVSFDGANGQPTWRTIVGVAADVKQESLTSTPYPEIDVPLAQRPSPAIAMLVRSAGDPDALASPIRAVVQRLDPTLPTYAITTMDAMISESAGNRRMAMYLFAVFAGAALLLAASGLYGVMAYAVSQRTRAIGIRLALGATPTDILRLVVGEGLAVTAIGIVVGLIAAAALTRYLQTLLFGVTAHDPITFAAIALLLLVTALAACYAPARRAMRQDPSAALRQE
ncbi:MAG TPA: ABC transporter permease [Vicinamibacterales bacterium]|jgi:putative ABC transport system permease protein